jgi:hypothetical protein
MSVWPIHSSHSLLHGAEGDLLLVRITVEAHLLEELLEALAQAPFPINPDIHHHAEIGSEGKPAAGVHVEFPVWRQRFQELRELVDSHGVEASFTITSMLDEIRA